MDLKTLGYTVHASGTGGSKTHIVCIFLWRCEDICGTVRNVQFSGFTPEPKLSVAVSVRAELLAL